MLCWAVVLVYVCAVHAHHRHAAGVSRQRQRLGLRRLPHDPLHHARIPDRHHSHGGCWSASCLGFRASPPTLEITAMRASGMGALDFVRIISILSTVALAFGLLNTLYLEPKGAANLLALEESLKSSQGSTFEVQPRVFYEKVQRTACFMCRTFAPVRVRPSGVTSSSPILPRPPPPHITTADQALVTSSGAGTLTLHLRDGSQHQISPKGPRTSTTSATFATTELAHGDRRAGGHAHLTLRHRQPGPAVEKSLLALASTDSHSTLGAGEGRAALPDRVQPALFVPVRLPGADAGRRPARPVVQARRQIDRLLC